MIHSIISISLEKSMKNPKTKRENNIRRTKPGNDQKRENQTIINKAAWHKQTTDIERQQNGGMIERRPIPDIA